MLSPRIPVVMTVQNNVVDHPMPKQSRQDYDRLLALWQICFEAYIKQGHKLSLPKNTDPSRTYQWRYLQALDRKLREWDFDRALIISFITVVAEYAKRNKLIHKGLSVFCQSNILDKCYYRLKELQVFSQSHVAKVRQCKRWFDGEMNGDVVSILLHRDRRGAYPNIVKWYQAGLLYDSLLAISKICGMAMLRLNTEDKDSRQQLPNLSTLTHLRATLQEDKSVWADLRDIMGDDWRTQ